MSGCGCAQQQAAQQQAEMPATRDLENWFDAGDAPAGQAGVDLFLALTEAGAEVSTGAEADELAAVEFEDDLAAQQELDEALAEESGPGEAVEPGLDELLALLKSRPGLKITLSY